MAILKIDMKMTNPNEAHDFWANIYDLGKVLAPWATVGVVCHQLINKVFRYFSDSRDAELREIVKREVQPKLDELNDKMDKIQQSIGRLSKDRL